VTTATAPAIAPRAEVAADERRERGFFAAAFFLDREAAGRAAVRLAFLRVDFARVALDRFVVRRAVRRAPARVPVFFADDRFAALPDFRFATSAPY